MSHVENPIRSAAAHDFDILRNPMSREFEQPFLHDGNPPVRYARIPFHPRRRYVHASFTKPVGPKVGRRGGGEGVITR